MPASKKEEIQIGLIARLEKLTSANGYDTDVQNVFVEEIPMGLDLDEHQVPAILVVSGVDTLERSHQWVKGSWEFEFQLWHNEVTDAIMQRFVRDVAKVIFADSPTAVRNEAWRGAQPIGIHESVYNVWQQEIIPDLNMLEANRCYICDYLIQYQTRPHDL